MRVIFDSDYNDTIFGNNETNVIFPGEGFDWIDAGGGSDKIVLKPFKGCHKIVYGRESNDVDRVAFEAKHGDVVIKALSQSELQITRKHKSVLSKDRCN